VSGVWRGSGGGGRGGGRSCLAAACSASTSFRSIRAESTLRKISPGCGALPPGKYTFLEVGYFWIFFELAIARASPSPIGKPFSATSIACSSTWAKVIVPQRSSRTYHASITPGSDAQSSPSLLGILPPLFLLYQSIVASFGAVPSALIEYTRFSPAR